MHTICTLPHMIHINTLAARFMALSCIAASAARAVVQRISARSQCSAVPVCTRVQTRAHERWKSINLTHLACKNAPGAIASPTPRRTNDYTHCTLASLRSKVRPADRLFSVERYAAKSFNCMPKIPTALGIASPASVECTVQCIHTPDFWLSANVENHAYALL